MSVDAIDPGVRRSDRNSGEELTILVLSDDPIQRAGVANVFDAAGAVCTATGSDHALRLAAPIWDFVVVLPESSRHPDRLASTAVVSDLARNLGGASIVGVVARPVPLVAELRFAEAGFEFLLPYRCVETDTQAVLDAMRHRTLSGEHRTASVTTLRAQLGFRENGSVEDFLEIAAKHPPEVWITNRPQASLGITRQDVAQLRRSAADVAGLPIPASARFSSSAVRSARELPAWGDVRDFVRNAWGLTDDRR